MAARKLDEGAVREILRRHDAGDDSVTIAGGMGVSRVAVQSVLNGRTWNQVTGLPRKGPYVKPQAPDHHVEKVRRCLCGQAKECRGTFTSSWAGDRYCRPCREFLDGQGPDLRSAMAHFNFNF